MEAEMTGYRGILFDLDGTLLDTLPDLHKSVNAALDKYGMPQVSRDDVRRSVGNGIRKLIARVVRNGEENPRFEETLRFFAEHYEQHCTEGTGPYEGVIPLLRTIHEQDRRVAVLSNKFDAATKKLCARYFGEYVDLAIGENEQAGVRKKPAPDMAFSIMREWNLQKEDCLLVGDSEVDIQTAEHAGIACICVTWGFRDKAALVRAGGKIFADTPSEVLDHILGRKTTVHREAMTVRLL